MAGQLGVADFARLHAHPRLIQAVPFVNSSFEKGLTGWERTSDAGDAVGCDAGLVPMWGAKMFGWTHRAQGENSRTVIFQKVKAAPGQWYSFSGSVYTGREGGRSSDVKVRLLALPGGGGDAVRDSQQIVTSQWSATDGQWRRGAVEFQAAAETVTVGFDLEQRFNLPRSRLYVDGALLERIRAK